MSTKSTHEEDRELLAKIADGDREAEKRLVEKYFAPIGAFLKHHLHHESRVTAEDLRQDLFAEILPRAHRGEIEIESTFIGFLHRAALHKIWRAHETDKKLLPLEPKEAEKCEALDHELYETLRAFEREEPRLNDEEVGRVMARLKPEVRQILIMRFEEGMSHGEIAAKLRKSVEAERQICHRAKAAFIKEYRKLFVTLLPLATLLHGVERLMESA